MKPDEISVGWKAFKLWNWRWIVVVFAELLRYRSVRHETVELCFCCRKLSASLVIKTFVVGQAFPFPSTSILDYVSCLCLKEEKFWRLEQVLPAGCPSCCPANSDNTGSISELWSHLAKIALNHFFICQLDILCRMPPGGVVVNFDLGERFPRPRSQQRGSLRPRAWPWHVAVLGVGAGGARLLPLTPPDNFFRFLMPNPAFGPENKLIEGQPNEYNVICRNASVLSFHLWPTVFAGAPFRLQNICQNGVPPRSRTTHPWMLRHLCWLSDSCIYKIYAEIEIVQHTDGKTSCYEIFWLKAYRATLFCYNFPSCFFAVAAGPTFCSVPYLSDCRK